ncbi:MAG: hypothetical protein K9L89_05470, partial [Kiritimatiellales bacterium]|nr:hypothetical protein [Kiritimatiellales bacterium]
MKQIFSWMFVLVFSALSVFAQLGDPFTVDARVDGDVVRLTVAVPEKHYLYAEQFKVTDAQGNVQEAVDLPKSASIIDPNTGHAKPVYDKPFTAVFKWAPAEGGASALHVLYWGCNDNVCFIPQTKVVALGVAPEVPEAVKSEAVAMDDWKAELENFAVLETGVGYMKAGPFLRFLDKAENGDQTKVGGFRLFLTDPVAFVRESGLSLTILFILLGGLALNLTPCVLPMIPINLAIIGAGAQAGSKRRGFALGAVYGLGIALVYGLLGAGIVLTGSRFGTIQANP